MSSEEIHHADFANFTASEKSEVYQNIYLSAQSLFENQNNWVCNLANLASLLWHGYQALNLNVNWAGFYVQDKLVLDQLILGPFMGKVACQTIQFGKGVCGTAASSKLTQVVQDVTAFPGHIACDGLTKSEIVVPVIKNGIVVAVIDIDSEKLGAFDEMDRVNLEKIAMLASESCEW